MTISTTTAKKVYTANGSATIFGWDFYVPNTASLIVNKTALDGTLSVLTLGTDYTVSGIGTNSGSVTILGSPLASGILITLQRSVPLLQGTDLTNQDGFYPEVIEAAFDLLTMMVQQNTEAIGRAIKSPISDTGTLTMPTAAARAGKVLGFDGSGNPVPGGNVSDFANLTAAVVAAQAAQTAAQNARDSALAAYANFVDKYLGAFASDPTLDLDGSALDPGDMYYNTVSQGMRLYTGSVWVNGYVQAGAFLTIANNLSDLANAATARTNLGLGSVAIKDTGTGSGQIPILDGSGKLVSSTIPGGVGVFASIAVAEVATVSTATALIPFDDTIPQITEGTEIVTITVTTTTTAQRVRLHYEGTLSYSVVSNLTAALFVDAGANAVHAVWAPIDTAGASRRLTFDKIVSPGAAGTYTYRVRIGGSSAGTLTVNGQAGARFLGGVATQILVAELIN